MQIERISGVVGPVRQRHLAARRSNRFSMEINEAVRRTGRRRPSFLSLSTIQITWQINNRTRQWNGQLNRINEHFHSFEIGWSTFIETHSTLLVQMQIHGSGYTHQIRQRCHLSPKLVDLKKKFVKHKNRPIRDKNQSSTRETGPNATNCLMTVISRCAQVKQKAREVAFHWTPIVCRPLPTTTTSDLTPSKECKSPRWDFGV